jgi:mono/diheme cytochrome c family protein
MTRNTRHWRFAVALLFGTSGLIAGVEMVLGHGKEHNPGRAGYLQKEGIPAEYEGLLNPLRATAEHLAVGRELYEEHCASCHGTTGDGRGEAAEGLEPPPAALEGMFAMPMTGMADTGADTHLMHGVAHHHPGQTHAEAMGGLNLDAYMFWAMAEGGEAFGSAMPAFDEILTETERWQILVYVANGFSIDAR